MEEINNEIDDLNSISGSHKEIRRSIKKKQSNILKILETELKLVPKNHYRNTWMAIGMAAFGLPFGVIFSFLIGNMAFLGIGLPIGLAVGMGIGAEKDKESQNNNKQLNFEITY
ncbi:hypothetical protein DCC35_18365 [Mangrovivirga cuniculi]|uniref:Uncharacterized protein n=1 Tax=Mangrovivirga cuniculi TaxID=2715131 RepID=A0A4D7K8U1_9BACT|nr:hypothetical protein DCC35_18365 [Mangrovivirga cuniculi]